MNSNPILNREIVTQWNGVAQAAERNKLGKSLKTKLIHTSKNKLFLTLLDTEQIQHHVTNIQQEYIVCETISYQFERRRRPKKLQKNIFY